MSSKFPFSFRSCGYNILKPCKGNNAAFEFGNIILYHLASHLFCSDLKWICKLNALFIINILTSNLFHNIRHVREFYKIQCFYWIVSTNILKHHRTASELIINYSMYFICYIWNSVWLDSPHRSTAETLCWPFELRLKWSRICCGCQINCGSITPLSGEARHGISRIRDATRSFHSGILDIPCGGDPCRTTVKACIRNLVAKWVLLAREFETQFATCLYM